MISTNKRTAHFADLKPYCTFARSEDFMEVTHWTNGEGADVHISNVSGVKNFSLTHGEFALLQILMNYQEAHNV